MKKRALTWLFVVPTLAAVLFFALWQRALHDQTELEAFAQAQAAEAYTCFLDFQASGADSDYWSGAAAFHAFCEAYGLLTEGTGKSANHTFCKEVSGSLLASPENARKELRKLLDALELLSQNIRDENGYLKILELRNALRQ